MVGGARRPEPGRLSKAEKGKGKATAIEVPDSPITIQDSSEEEDEDEFEEVAIPSHVASSSLAGTPLSASTPNNYDVESANEASLADVDIGHGYLDDEDEEPEEERVIQVVIGGETEEQKAKRIALALRKKPLTAKDRAIRLQIHKLHVVTLLASAKIRNQWASNALLKARLLSLLPHPLQAAFVIPPKRFPDRAQRSRLFLDALQSLVTWWSQAFFDVSDPSLGMQTRTWDSVQEIVDRLPRLQKADFQSGSLLSSRPKKKSSSPKKGKGKGKEKAGDDDIMDLLEDEIPDERLRSVNSVMKKALQQEGSRDMSALLFVSLARACGLGARLVVSLQPVPWRAEKAPPKKKPRAGAGSGAKGLHSRQGMGPDPESEDEDEFEEVPIPGVDDKPGKLSKKNRVRGAGHRLKDPADVFRLRQPRPAPQRLGSKPKPKPKPTDLSAYPPVFWAEVFSRSDQRWIPVDPLTGVIRKKAPFEPSNDNGPVRMIYVVGFEEDGYARDVTLRYAKNFGAKTSKLRPPPQKDGTDWWAQFSSHLQRPIRLNRDDLEDAELEMSQVSEGMPLHMTGFKDHPIYVLERHLKREEVILPKREIGRFKGEPVYRRKNVLACRTADNWMRIGRTVKIGQDPLKWVKQRAVTIQKRRAQELAIQEQGEPIQQGLYAEYQTELYYPPPIKDGIIPQNAFGNIDLYVPTMLPAGAAHLPFKGIAKVAKQMGVSYAEAVTSFEFKSQRAVPVITGIVVAEEKEAAVLDAYYKSTAAADERAKIRKEELALKRWAKLVNGLRVRLRLRAEYGTGEELHNQQHNPMGDVQPARNGPDKKTAASIIALSNNQNTEAWVERFKGRTPSPEPIEEAEAVEEPVEEPVALTRASRRNGATPAAPIKIKLNVTKAAPKAAAKSTPKAKASARPKRASRGKRARDDDDSEAESSEDSDATPRRVPAPAPAAPTRSLRSRAPKSEQQQREEAERRAAVRAALASDEEEY